jgi:tetratricopeptide (TPR) repeat protein
VAFLRQSVAAAPNFADAWGALALGYRHLIEGRGFDDPATAALARSAAARALALDPGNADARVALILLRPYFRNWWSLEQGIRDALVTYPRHWLLWANLGRVLSEVGRWEEAIGAFARAVEIDPFLPLASSRQALTLWWGGRLQEADTALLRAASRWPAHPAVWFTRFDFLALTGRPAEAAALAQDVGNRPFGVPAERFELSTLLATALRSGHGPGPDPASTLLAAAKRSVVSTGTATLYLCAFGRLDDAFGLLQEDYFGGRGPPPAGLARRYTDVLFAPATAPLRADPRFARMTAALGLDAYWRAAGHGPDDRRAMG